MSRDKLGDCGEIDFFFLRFGDDDVRIGGVSSSFASKFELRVWCFFVRGSIYRSPVTPVLSSFFVVDMEDISDRCWSFKYELVFLEMGTPPL